jgi:8-oxo-dGTP diphosphatase
MTCAYLFSNNEILMMKRSSGNTFMPDIWTGVGGHMESAEINDPRATCIREINEETGLKETDIHDLKLKYVTLRRKNNEIRVQYIFFGNVEKREVSKCDEGELHWIKESDIMKLNMSITNTQALAHYFENGRESNDIFVGVVDASGKNPVMKWMILESFDMEYEKYNII